MRVAYICADAGVPVFGTKGCSVHVQEIVKQFLKRGDEVDLYALRLGGVNNQPSTGFRWLEFSLGQAATTADREILHMQAAEEIARQLGGQDFDLVYERYSLWSYQALEQARHMKVPAILEVNAPLIEEQSEHRELDHNAEAQMIRDRAFRLATSIVAVSDGVAEYVREHLPASQHGKVHVVPNGVDVDRFRPDVPPQTPNAAFTVGFVGTLKPWHGLESLLAAFRMAQRRQPELALRIVGDGPLRVALQAQVRQEMPAIESQIQWMGAVHPQDMPAQLTALDVAVAPYVDSTNFYFSPLKVFEYMAAGRAIVAGSIGQLTTVIEHARTGMLYSPGNADRLADCLCQLASQHKLVAQLGAAARQRAIEQHSWRSALEKILERADADYRLNQRFQRPVASSDELPHRFCGTICGTNR